MADREDIARIAILGVTPMTAFTEADLSALEALAKAMRAALKAHEECEAHVILHADWHTEDGLPHLTELQMDDLSAVQNLRNAALADRDTGETGGESNG